MDADALRAFAPSGIILSGGPESVTEAGSPRTSDTVWSLGVPVLGICYGMQAMAVQLGGSVEPGEVKEFGYAEIREVFKVSGVGKVAGCLVTEGTARRSAGVRLLRDNVVIHEGTLKTLKRFKDEVSDVQSGQECGMAFENYEDIRPGDVIEIFEREEVTRTL